MLTLPDGDDRYRIVGIDPGTDTLGAAWLEVDLVRKAIILIEAHTFDGTRMAKRYSWISPLHGDRTARLMAHEENLYLFFEYVKPHVVASEAPYMRKFPQAFQALVECMTFIRRALFRYDEYIVLEPVDPPTAKMAVGMTIKKGSTKDDVKRAVLALKTLENPMGIDLEQLDEHSIDAIAVGYWRAKLILDLL
jgi:Holliday junction resolvasome RuvABC endonuclease subunit